MRQPHRLWNRAGRYLGRRGALLVLLGLAWVAIGIGFAVTDVDRFSKPGPGGPLEFMDTTPYPGLFWVICGVIGFASGLLRRKLHNEDAAGFAALIMPPIAWACSYAVSFTVWVATDKHYGVGSSWIGCIVYDIIVIIILVISHWRDDLDEKYLILMRIKDPALSKELLDESRYKRKPRGIE